MPFSARIRPNFFAASMNSGFLPGPEAQYTQIDLIVLMGKGCGAAGAGRQGAPVTRRAPSVTRGQKRVEDARRRAYDPRLHHLRKNFCEGEGLHRNSGLPELRSIMRRKSGKPDLRCQARQSRVGIFPFGVLVVRKGLYMTVVRRGCACGPPLLAGVREWILILRARR